MRNIFKWLALGVPPVAALSASAPFLAHHWANPLELNQFLLQDLAVDGDTNRSEAGRDRAKSKFFSGLGILKSRPNSTPPPLEEPESVFEWIFSWIPEYAVVYPTERFYYFSFQHGETQVMGNLRLAEADQGRISFAYFTVPDKQTWIHTFSAENGLEIDPISASDYLLTYGQKSVHFKIQRTELIGPGSLATLPEERLVGQLFDESGVRLFVLFNEETSSFYNVLNEEDPLCEDLVALGSTNFVVGSRTGFVFYDDAEFRRKLLVGVALENVKANNYLDGPGDQVPIALDLRDRLHRAYPNTLLGAGIDEHGVYLEKPEWARIAVSPYIRYSSLDEFPERAETCEGEQDRSILWTCLTKEWWNTDRWRNSVLEKLEAEGKTVDPSTPYWTQWR